MSELIEETVLRIKELQDQVDKVLFYEWDPLGVSTMDYMRDEYSRYVLEVVEIALECSSYEAIEEELVFIRKEWMGMEDKKPINTPTCLVVGVAYVFCASGTYVLCRYPLW